MSRKQKDKVVAVVKLILNAGKATPANPVGPTLGGYGINLGAFVREYNERTAHQAGMNVPVEITIYADRSFSMRVLQPTSASLLRRAAGVAKGSSTPGRSNGVYVTRTQLRDVAQAKMDELNALDIDAAMRTLAGTARSMGITIVDDGS